MRIIRFGQGRFGVATEDGVHDVTSLVAEWTPATAGAAFNVFIERFEDLRPAVERLVREGPAIPLADVHLEAPVAPWQFFAAPRNYKAHQDEMKGHLTLGGGSPAELGFFLKATGCISGPNDPIELPKRPGRRFDYEGELAFVMGPRTQGVSRDEALTRIFGYTVLLDMSMRMTETEREERVFRKSFHSFAPVGPWIVTADEIPDPSTLHLRTWVNDELRQDAPVGDLIVDVPGLLAQAASVLPLQPGDIYATGTPAGVGPIEPGDLISVEITSIGRIDIPVVERSW